MASNTPFGPNTQATVSITGANTTARVALGGKSAIAVRVYNSDGTNPVFINFGNSTVTATAPNGATPGSVPIGPGGVAVFSINPDSTTHVAAIAPAGTPIVYFTPGAGVG